MAPLRLAITARKVEKVWALMARTLKLAAELQQTIADLSHALSDALPRRHP